jgi:predicted  nucleic acid-binding Zn-ribbon protein
VPGIAAAAAVAGLIALNATSAHPQLATEVSYLNSSLDDLREKSGFGDLQVDISSLDSNLNNVIQLLESVRQKGFVYQKDLDETAYQLMSQWESVRDQVYNALNQNASLFQNRIPSLNPNLQRLNANLGNPAAAGPLLRSSQEQVNSLLADIDRASQNVQSTYATIESTTHQLTTRLTQIHWALDQLSTARFQLNAGEDLIMAVATRWDREGDDDPEGILYLTNRRLIFERKEKVATKKVLFITTASELVQEVLVDQMLSTVSGHKAENKGLFGHQDFLMVQFSEAKLGVINFHLNGQDSKDWSDLVERARTGRIEEERTAAGGISLSDMSKPLTTADIVAVQNDINALQDEAMIKEARQELAELENILGSQERKLSALRAHGYDIEKDLEADLQILLAQWERIRSNAEKTIETETRLLGDGMNAVRQGAAQLAGMSANLVAARPVYLQLKSSIASLQAQADAAESTVYAQYDEYADEVENLAAHLEWVDWMLEALATASFRLLATESGVAAAEALFSQPGMPVENGILFLTDQRLLWEDRVGTYELKLEVPLQSIEEVHKETGEQPSQEFLVFGFSPGTPLATGRIQLAMPVADAWLQMIGRARSGGYAQDRAKEIDPEELERIRNAPSLCPNCSAVYSSPILRGQTDIVCEYCGVATRI